MFYLSIIKLQFTNKIKVSRSIGNIGSEEEDAVENMLRSTVNNSF